MWNWGIFKSLLSYTNIKNMKFYEHKVLGLKITIKGSKSLIVSPGL